MICLLKYCRKCRGDLVLDGDEWRCWQCGRYYYPKIALWELPEEPPNPNMHPGNWSAGDETVRLRKRRTSRDVNSTITAVDQSDRRWWLKNLEVIRYLDQGLSVRDISGKVSRGERQVRVVRERLNDMRG